MALISASAQALSTSSGPYEISGNLYVVVSLVSRIAVFKSTDSGATWSEQDSAGAPSAGHVWYDVFNDSGDLHVVHVNETASSPFQANLPVSIFNTSTDTWDLTTPAGPSINYTTVDPTLVVDRGIGVKIVVRDNGDIVVIYLSYFGSGTEIGLYFHIYDGVSWVQKKAGDSGYRRVAGAFLLPGSGEVDAFVYQYASFVNDLLDSPNDSKLELIANTYLTSSDTVSTGGESAARNVPRNLGSYPSNTPRVSATSAVLAFAVANALGTEDLDDVGSLPSQSQMSPLNLAFDRVNHWVAPATDQRVNASDAPLTGVPAMHSLVASGAVFIFWISGSAVYHAYRCTDYQGLFKAVTELELANTAVVCPVVVILSGGDWGVVYQASTGVYYEEIEAPEISCPVLALAGDRGNVAAFTLGRPAIG